LSLILSAIELARSLKNARPFLRDVSQLVCLANLETLNALFIGEGVNQEKRLKKLNELAIKQMKILLMDKNIERLENK
jgi:hypothetical protein